jgi:hypothetical protein
LEGGNFSKGFSVRRILADRCFRFSAMEMFLRFAIGSRVVVVDVGGWETPKDINGNVENPSVVDIIQLESSTITEEHKATMRLILKLDIIAYRQVEFTGLFFQAKRCGFCLSCSVKRESRKSIGGTM